MKGEIIYSSAPAEALTSLLERLDADRVFVLTDSNVASLAARLVPAGEHIVIAPGEGSKTLEGAVSIWRRLVNAGATRRSVLVNVGGGVVSDLGGFVAATFKRGMRAVNVATTLLAAADAAIGGKTGIDFEDLKNEIGVFAMPEAVVISEEFLQTLPEAELLSGFGEVVKMALLTDAGLYGALLNGDALADASLMGRAMRNAAEAKARIVRLDPREQGLRRILNLGHTVGHALEMVTAAGEYPLSHGAAVAHGILAALILSERYAGLDPSVRDDYKTKILDRYYQALSLTAEECARVIALMAHDKKNRRAGEISFVLIEAPGEPVQEYSLPSDPAQLLPFLTSIYCPCNY